jgi:hypothetical protein
MAFIVKSLLFMILLILQNCLGNDKAVSVVLNKLNFNEKPQFEDNTPILRNLQTDESYAHQFEENAQIDK